MSNQSDSKDVLSLANLTMPDFSSRAEPVDPKVVTDIVDNVSKRYPKSVKLNDGFRWFMRGGLVVIGSMGCLYPEEIKDRDPMDVLRAFCRQDRRSVEDAVMEWRARFGIRKRYLDGWAAMLATPTPLSNIPVTLDLGRFFKEEARIFGIFQEMDSMEDGEPDEHGNAWAGSRWPEGEADPEARFVLHASYSAIAEWERENKRQFFGSMDPPWHTLCLYFTEAQVLEALDYALSHGGDSCITPEVRDMVVGEAEGKCPFCGRDVVDCGPLAARHLFSGSGSCSPSEPDPAWQRALGVVPMCDDCTWIWQLSRDRAREKPDLFETRYGYWHRDGWTVAALRDFAGATAYAARYCKSRVGKLRERPEFDPDGEVDVDAYIKYARSKYAMKHGVEAAGSGRCRSSIGMDALYGVDADLDEEDMDAVRKARRAGSVGEALEILSARFGPLVRPMPGIVDAGVIDVDGLCKPVDKSEPGQARVLADFPEDAVRILEDYAKANGDGIADMVQAAGENRRLAVRYAKAVRRGLDPYSANIHGDLDLLDIPWRCFYVATRRTANGDSQGFAWSLERMAGAAGIQGLPGRYVPPAKGRYE